MNTDVTLSKEKPKHLCTEKNKKTNSWSNYSVEVMRGFLFNDHLIPSESSHVQNCREFTNCSKTQLC